MSIRLFRSQEDSYELESDSLDDAEIQALENETRRRILDIVSEEPSYPAAVAKKLGISKQKAYYHFEKLLDAELLEKIDERELSGGKAKVYSTAKDALHYDLNGRGEKMFLPPDNSSVERFLSPLIEEGKINGEIVVGSPEPHGEDRVRAMDGHLSGDLAAKLGNYGKMEGEVVKLDTQLKSDENYQGNYLILGGILTNTASRKFNGAFPVKFTGESFPYREARTPEEKFSDRDIGFISKVRNPEDEDSFVYLIAGIGRRGTRGAVKAFQELENIVEDYSSGSFLRTVRALDSDGDGEIDSYELLE